MKKFLVFIALILTAGTGVVQAQSTATHAAITFEIKNLGISTGGSIAGMMSKVHFNPANLNASTIEASVDVGTINTDNSSRDEHLRSEDFFDVAKYPRITLKSTAIRHKSGANYVGTFTLTIKDKSKQVEIPFVYNDKGNAEAFKGSFKINRLDYGVGGSSMVLSDDVIIRIDCEVKKVETAQL